MTACAILFSDDPFIADTQGCLLPDGHSGPHEFVSSRGVRYCWETDWECNCDHCAKAEGDYCTTYWRADLEVKPF